MDRNAQWIRRWVEISADLVGENREYLIELDRRIGDGDHGENMDRGFSAVVRGDGLSDAETGSELMKYIAKTLLSSVGGAAGPLYGTAYLRAAPQVPETDLTAGDVANLLEAAVGGIQARGKAEAGEKTMVDAWLPAAQAAGALDPDESAVAALSAAARAAEEGAEATIPLKATKGRASYLGERSRGHMDPGAASSAMLIGAGAQAAMEVFGGEN